MREETARVRGGCVGVVRCREATARGVQRKQEPHFGCGEKQETHFACGEKQILLNMSVDVRAPRPGFGYP